MISQVTHSHFSSRIFSRVLVWIRSCKRGRGCSG